MPQLLRLALSTAAACSPPDVPKPAQPSRGISSAGPGPSKATFAIVRITRTLVDDDHPLAGGDLPHIDLDSMRVVLDYGRRAPDTRPVIRTYTVRVAVPSDHPRSWDVNLGDDYDLLIATRGFTVEEKGVRIAGHVKSNYQLQLNENKAPQGPNSFGFGVQPVGERAVVQVMNDEAPGRIFREFDVTEIEALTDTPPDLPTVGIDESEDAQQGRWKEWPVIRKRGLR